VNETWLWRCTQNATKCNIQNINKKLSYGCARLYKCVSKLFKTKLLTERTYTERLFLVHDHALQNALLPKDRPVLWTSIVSVSANQSSGLWSIELTMSVERDWQGVMVIHLWLWNTRAIRSRICKHQRPVKQRILSSLQVKWRYSSSRKTTRLLVPGIVCTLLVSRMRYWHLEGQQQINFFSLIFGCRRWLCICKQILFWMQFDCWLRRASDLIGSRLPYAWTSSVYWTCGSLPHGISRKVLTDFSVNT